MKAWLGGLIGRRIIIFLLTGVAAPVLINLGVPPDTVNWLIGLAGVAIGGLSVSDAARNWGVTTPPPSETK